MDAKIERKLQIAAAGRHGVLAVRPRGIDAEPLGMAMAAIMPPLDEAEAEEVSAVYAGAGLEDAFPAGGARPFRKVAPPATLRDLVGGGKAFTPGEASLAHGGVLMVDDLHGFSPATVLALRYPFEYGEVRIVRADGCKTLPTRFGLLAATDPCPCGRYGASEQPCSCSEERFSVWRRRLGGSLSDLLPIRIDLGGAVEPMTDVSAAALRASVCAAREFRRRREGRETLEYRAWREAHACESAFGPDEILFCMQACADGVLDDAKLKRILPVARTIADLSEHEMVRVADIREALEIS